MPLFGTSKKSPTEVVRNLRDTFLTLEKGADSKKQEKVRWNILKCSIFSLKAQSHIYFSGLEARLAYVRTHISQIRRSVAISIDLLSKIKKTCVGFPRPNA